MFSVLFDVRPHPERRDEYLNLARLLRPELERIDGFVDNVRYRSLTREGWVLSLSGWRDEKALVRWRTQALHHGVQEKGRAEVFLDYRLRVGEVTQDTGLPAGQALRAQRLDETRSGGATLVTLLDAPLGVLLPQAAGGALPAAVGRAPAWAARSPGLLAWDVFDAVLAPGEAVLRLCWRDAVSAEAFEAAASWPAGVQRRRRVRIVRDYGMFDRREAPQYFPDAAKGG